MDSRLLGRLRDPVEQRLLREALEARARDDGDPLARDMARGVLAGNITLYEAVGFSVYREVFAKRAAEQVRWWQDLPDDERGRLDDEGGEADAE
ncbi:hypothetical protein ABNF97_22380 [Plantactinospora sp. B6F1]|uniref:hypothetical protein n=1 Tax=Plantactinospora sp. B6F1 TaxID=3158971 RepID=UPI0032D957F7